jgi:hypothetical protein
VAKTHVANAGERSGGADEQALAQAQAQLEYEIKARQIEFDARMKLRSLAETSLSGQGDDPMQQFAARHQDAYQTYLSDLQRAWSGVKELDPHSTSAIASSIMFTMSAAC